MCCLMLACTGHAFSQINDSLRIPGISKHVFWENTPKDFHLDDSSLTIVAGTKTDMFRDPNVTYNTDNAPKLLFAADSNFVFTASVEHQFVNKWDGGALVIKQDSLNWVKLCFEKDYTGVRRVVSVVTKGISDDCNSVEINSNTIFYKVAKAGNVITLYYSSTGTGWYLIRHFTFDAVQPLKVGFLAQSPTGNECRVKFSRISYLVKKITDPYLGD